MHIEVDPREPVLDSRRPQQHLPGHAEVRDEGGLDGLDPLSGQRQPHELPAPLRFGEHAADEPLDEVLGGAVVAAQRALVVDLDGLDAGAGDGGGETGADDLDLGEFGHQPAAESAVHASSAAAISASFLLEPEPVAAGRPSMRTVAVKRLRWSGPESVTS